MTRLPIVGLSPLLSVTVTLATACELFAGAVYFISKMSETGSNRRFRQYGRTIATSILPLDHRSMIAVFLSRYGKTSTALLTRCLNIFAVNRPQCPYGLGQEFSYAYIPPYAF